MRLSTRFGAFSAMLFLFACTDGGSRDDPDARPPREPADRDASVAPGRGLELALQGPMWLNCVAGCEGTYTQADLSLEIRSDGSGGLRIEWLDNTSSARPLAARAELLAEQRVATEPNEVKVFTLAASVPGHCHEGPGLTTEPVRVLLRVAGVLQELSGTVDRGTGSDEC